MVWVLLCVAGVFEVGWVVFLKYSDGFTRPVPAVLTVVSITVSFVLLNLCLKWLPLGTAYAVWTGIGAAGSAALGIVLFAEPASALRIVSIGLIIAGIAGLKLAP